jgi:hypothetical protein
MEDLLAGKAEVFGRRFPVVLLGNNGASSELIAAFGDFSPFLRCVIFVGQPALCFGFDDQGIGLDLPACAFRRFCG